MWAPGTLLTDRRSRSPFILMVVLSSRQVGFGTRGPLYEVLFLESGSANLCLSRLWCSECNERFTVHMVPAEEMQ